MFTFKRNQIIITVLVFMIAIAAYLNTKDNGAGVKPNLVQETDLNKEGVAEEKDFFEGYDENAALPPDGDLQASETMNTENKEQAAEADKKADVTAKADTSKPSEEIAKADKKEAAAITAEAVTPEKFEAVITKKDAVLADSEANKENAVTVDKNLDVSYFAEEKMLREQSRELQLEQLKQYVANENLDKAAKSKAAANLLAIQERIEKESSAEALLRAKGFKEVYVRIDDNSVDVVVNKDKLTDSDIAQIEEIVNRKTGYSVGKIKITPLKGIVKDEANQ